MTGYDYWEKALEQSDIRDVSNACEALVQRMQDLNGVGTTTRSRNLSIAISTMETVIDKLDRAMRGE